MINFNPHADFLRHAVLDTIVPHATDIDIEAALTSSLEGGAVDLPSALSSIPQRSLLFFDETVPVRIILRLSGCSEDTLKCHLPKLDVKLEAFVVGPADAGNEGSSSTPPKDLDLIFSGTVNEKEDPLVVVNVCEEAGESCSQVYVTWKVDAFLYRPRIRLQHPCIVFTASAALRPTENPSKSLQSDEYLPSLIPASINVLQALSVDQALSSTSLFLPASRLLRVVPAAQTEEPFYQIQRQTHPIRVVPAASARIRCSRLTTYTSLPTTIASLDFEVTSFLHCNVVLDKTELELSDGYIEDLSKASGLTLPFTCHPRDDVTLVYKLTPEYGPESNLPTTAMVNVLDISMEAMILLSDDCKPRILMQWRTNVDFSMPLNPTFGGPSQVLQRNNRPASLPMTPTQGPSSKRSTLRERAHSTTRLGVSISFSGPISVEVSKPFHWNVFIVNRSGAPRKFALVAIPRRKRADMRRHVTRPSSTPGPKSLQVAEAVIDESIIHVMQKNGAGQDVELISLSTDIKIGPLLPGTCHSTELKLLPLTSGPLRLEAVRLVDINSNETADIRDLPDILALEMKGVS